MKQRKMMVFVAILALFAMLVLGCQKNSKQEKPGPVSPAPTAVTITEPWEQSAQKVTFYYSAHFPLTEEMQKNINRILYEKGIDCRIEFHSTGAYFDKDYEEWVSKNSPDILTAGLWMTYSDGEDFIRNHFLPLDEYLETAEGNAIRSAYSEAEWKSVSLDRNIYSVPKNFTYGKNNSGVYIAINDDYTEAFRNFDGTYSSLRNIWEAQNDSRLKIVFDSVGYDKVSALLGHGTVYHGIIPYDRVQRKTLTPSDFGSDVQALCSLIVDDMKSGNILVNPNGPEAGEKCLAFVYSGIRPSMEGYTASVLNNPGYEVNVLQTYGIYKNSMQKDLALKVLTACFSDARIASLLNWGVEEEEAWQERQRLLQTETAGELTGFHPNLSKEEEAALRRYEQSVLEIFNNLYRTDINGEYVLNSGFHPGALPSEAEAAVGIAGLNRELAIWFENEDNGQVEIREE